MEQYKEQYYQCLYYALDKWYTEGGYLVFGRSTHWCIPHTLHMSSDKVITHFAPPTDLKSPWYSLVGFKGVIYTDDTSIRKPMGVLCMLLGTVALFIFGSIWATKKVFRNIKEKL